MQSYEMVYIINGNAPEDEVKKIQKKILDLIEINQGKIVKEDFWGKKTLAYSIKKQEYGFYVLIYFDLAPEKLQSIENKIRLMDEIVRYLITKKKLTKAKKSKKVEAKKPELKKVVKNEKKEEKPKTENVKIKKQSVALAKKEEPKKEKSKLKKLEPKSKAEIEKVKKKALEEKEREKALDEKLEEILKEE